MLGKGRCYVRKEKSFRLKKSDFHSKKKKSESKIQRYNAILKKALRFGVA